MSTGMDPLAASENSCPNEKQMLMAVRVPTSPVVIYKYICVYTKLSTDDVSTNMVTLEILAAFAFAAAVLAQSLYNPWKQQHPHYLPGLHGAICPFKELSCHNTTAIDTCCLESPGGLVLQTQFWDTTIGPKDHWTVHGLCTPPVQRPGFFLTATDNFAPSRA
jgi:hypothetical protein